MSSATYQSVIVPVFAGKLTTPNFTNINVPNGLMGVNLAGNGLGIIALIGRDLLGSAVLTYHGMDGLFSISI